MSLADQFKLRELEQRVRALEEAAAKRDEAKRVLTLPNSAKQESAGEYAIRMQASLKA